MWVLNRTISPRILASAAALCAFAAIIVPVPALAGPAKGLCDMTTSRGTVPAKFPVDACVDGSNVWLYNTSTLVLRVVASGGVGKPHTTSTNHSLAVEATRLKYGGEWVLLPGDKMQIPIGSRYATVYVEESTAAQKFYALAYGPATFFPLPAALGALDTFADFIATINGDFNSYKNCIAGRNTLGRAACLARLSVNIQRAIGDSGLEFTAAAGHATLGVLLAGKTFTQWAGVQIPQLKALLHEVPIKQAALKELSLFLSLLHHQHVTVPAS